MWRHVRSVRIKQLASNKAYECQKAVLSKERTEKELQEIRASEPDATFFVNHNHFSDWTKAEIQSLLSQNSQTSEESNIQEVEAKET